MTVAIQQFHNLYQWRIPAIEEQEKHINFISLIESNYKKLNLCY